ncbi:MAG: hypothetical protein V1810_00840 [Candidatus Beckwithbacteria bacterium]
MLRFCLVFLLFFIFLQPVSAATSPLRPNPKELVSEEENRPMDDPYQTPYCAMRPTAVQVNQFDRRDEFINIQTIGTLTQNFTEFIAPLLSITDPDKPDYLLPYVDKAQRYLADYLEGRAYYEGITEPTDPTLEQQTDIFTRLGVFRKLAPQTYQDKLKRAIILRAAGKFNSLENPYGFLPATAEIHNYFVAEWSGDKIYLKDFVNNWAPLPEDFGKDQATYADAYEAWKNLDNGKWYQLWPYVPMFTREDSKGYIEIIDSNPPPDPWSPPGSTPIEINNSNKETVTVIHPDLARTYEVSTSLSYLLTPESVHEVPTPQTSNEWTPARWGESYWWLDPSLLQPSPAPGLEYGPHCDVETSIYSSGDLAYENIITTSVNRQDLHVPNPEYQGPPSQSTPCGLLYPCQRCTEDGIDDSGCIFTQPARSNPNYLITHTPFLNNIFTSTSTLSQRGIFAILNPFSEELKPDQEFAWPGLGNLNEESPEYKFSAGPAEAGNQKPGKTQTFFYRYLGSIQCAKERLLQTLEPFLTGQPYTPYAYKCFPELTPPATGDPGGGLGDSGATPDGPGDTTDDTNSPDYTLPADFVAGSCPIPDDGAFLLCGAYAGATNDGPGDCHHGSNYYWSYNDECAWPLPLSSNCYAPLDTNSTCYPDTRRCAEYGLAADFSYPSYAANLPVVLPTINSHILHWTGSNWYEKERNYGSIYRADDGVNIYEIFFFHLNAYGPLEADSGDIIGTISSLTASPHVHVELKIDGVNVNVDSLCSGQNIINTNDDNGEGVNHVSY